MKTKGPRIVLRVLCDDCMYYQRRSSYDSELEVWEYTTHCSQEDRQLQANRTPDWCPFKPKVVIV